MILTACGLGDCYKEQLVIAQVDSFYGTDKFRT